MNYKFVERANFEDFSGGRVIYHRPGFTNYPVRLACEIFMRCLTKIDKAKVNIYDPCCGSGYILTVLGFLYGDRINAIYGSDLSSEAVSMAEKNLRLLSPEGLIKRKEELDVLYRRYGKDSHLQGIESAERLLRMVCDSEICCKVFKRDVLVEKEKEVEKEAYSIACIDNGTNMNTDTEIDIGTNIDMDVDIVITDVPYGNLVDWSASGSFAIDAMLENIKTNLNPKAVVAISSDKGQKINNPAYIRVEKFKAGKRKVEILVRGD